MFITLSKFPHCRENKDCSHFLLDRLPEGANTEAAGGEVVALRVLAGKEIHSGLPAQ